MIDLVLICLDNQTCWSTNLSFMVKLVYQFQHLGDDSPKNEKLYDFLHEEHHMKSVVN